MHVGTRPAHLPPGWKPAVVDDRARSAYRATEGLGKLLGDADVCFAFDSASDGDETLLFRYVDVARFGVHEAAKPLARCARQAGHEAFDPRRRAWRDGVHGTSSGEDAKDSGCRGGASPGLDFAPVEEASRFESTIGDAHVGAEVRDGCAEPLRQSAEKFPGLVGEGNQDAAR